MGGLKLGGGGGASGGGADNRNALLQSIQMGAKLKKVQTIDKSGPLLAGKVAGGDGNGSGSLASQQRVPAASSSSSSANGFGGGPKLGGIFEGLSSMPKLKPVGSRGE